MGARGLQCVQYESNGRTRGRVQSTRLKDAEKNLASLTLPKIGGIAVISGAVGVKVSRGGGATVVTSSP